MSRGSKKQELIAELQEQFRVSGSQDIAFDDATADALGVNRTDLNALDVIERQSRITAGELAAQLGLTTGAVTAMVDRLEQAGYARRVRDPKDRRKVMVETTEKLIERAGPIYGPMVEEWSEMMNRATAEQLQLMIDFMRRANEVKPRHIERLRRAD